MQLAGAHVNAASLSLCEITRLILGQTSTNIWGYIQSKDLAEKSLTRYIWMIVKVHQLQGQVT